jgi:hypothetical protein
MGENSTWHERCSVGDSLVMTGIRHFLHLLAPHRLQFHFSFFHLRRCVQSSNRYGHAFARMGIHEFCGSYGRPVESHCVGILLHLTL